MAYLEGERIKERVDDIIHLETQLKETSLDLTVSEIHRVTEAGQLDFGGGEFVQASLARLHPERNNPEDDYGWWNLKMGTYLIEYNEKIELNRDETAEMSPLPRILKTGAFVPSSHLTPPDGPDIQTILTVPACGVALKENCRISTLRIFEHQS
jgi:deoxycytidine triphosphate deaminase